MRIKFAARSDVGHRRSNNEDNLYCNGFIMSPQDRDKPFFINGVCESPAIFAVFDGMGGHDCGELASLTAAETLHEHAGRIREGDYDQVNAYAQATNQKLLTLMRDQNIRTGTTLALLAAGEDSFRAYNLGDSRVYRLEGRTLIKVTDDHTMAQEQVMLGLMSPKKAEHDRTKHILTRCLGMGDSFLIAPDAYGAFGYRENVRALLCSDGLQDMLSHPEIAAIMSRDADVQDIVNELVDAALNKGGHDNVTCIVLDFGGAE